MKQNFNSCLNKVLQDEGGYSNDPSDSGGPTNFGITLGDYRLHINPQGTADDVKKMNINDAKNIYRSKYWDALDCDSLSSGVDYTVFDYGVNSGLQRPRKALERFKSLKSIQLIDAINNERTAFLQGLAASRPKDQKFLNGWMNRVSRVRSYSKSLATDKTTGPAVGGATAGIGVALAQYFHNHQSAIIISAIVIAIGVSIAIHIYKNKGN
jgi:lysozyme family protein